jgi:hypothetical protein
MLCDINLARTATFDGPGFGASLARLGIDDRYVGAPSRCADCTELANSWFEVSLEQPRVIALIAFLFQTMSPAASLRITLAGADRDLDNPVHVGDWRPILTAFYPFGSRPFEVENWWTGWLSSEDRALWPDHLLIRTPEIVVGAIRVEINDLTHPDGWFDIGGLFIAPTGFMPTINYDRGRDLALIARDLVSEGPSGRRFGERRRAIRQLTVKWSHLQTDEAYRLFDAGARAGTTETILFVPDLDDEVGMIREAWPATFERPPAPRFVYDTLNEVAGVFKEIVA